MSDHCADMMLADSYDMAAGDAGFEMDGRTAANREKKNMAA